MIDYTVNSHLRTTNKYVRLQIIRDNIAKLKNLQYSMKGKKLPFEIFKEVEKVLKQQEHLKLMLLKAIAIEEQKSIPFSNFKEYLLDE